MTMQQNRRRQEINSKTTTLDLILVALDHHIDIYDHFSRICHNPSSETTEMNETTTTTAALPGKAAQADTASDHRTNGEKEVCETAGDAGAEDQYEDEEDDDEDVTDDEEDMFFDQFDSNPHKEHRKDSYKEPMVPFECSDAEEALQHFVQVFEERYGELHPHFYVGSIENAIKEVTDVQDPQKLRPLLIFIHSDRSIMAHIFCSQVLCSQPVVEYLNANYIVWPWDITYQGNKDILLTMIEDSFSEDSLTDDQKKDDSFETHPSWLKQPQPLVTAHITPKSVLQQLTSQVDDLPACLIFYPVCGQPHSIQGTWLASKSCDNMSDSFLTTLVSSVENYKFLLVQNTNSPEARKIYEMLQEQQRGTYHIQPPPSQLQRPTLTQMGYSYSQILQNIKLVSGPVGQAPPVSHDQVHRDDHPGGQEVCEVDKHLGTPVDTEEPESKVDGASEEGVATKDAQSQEAPEEQHLQLKSNTDPSFDE